MGLDGWFIPPGVEYDVSKGISDIPHYPICGSSTLLRVVNNMPHYKLRETSGKSLREITVHLMCHIGKMAEKVNDYDYPKSFTKPYWSDPRSIDEVNLMSDLVIMSRFIGELHEEGIPDDWIVVWHT
jgi:hypothetical protein